MKPNLNPQFKRNISAHPSAHQKQIIVSYKPAGFWADEVISLNIEFTPTPYATKKSKLHVNGHSVEYRLKHSSGGQDDKCDPITTARNFCAAYEDAISFTEQVLSLVKSGVDYDTLAQYLSRLDMEDETLDTCHGKQQATIVLAHIGQGHVAGFNKIWLNSDVAKKALENIAEDVDFIEREGSDKERQYWWLMFNHFDTQIVA